MKRIQLKYFYFQQQLVFVSSCNDFDDINKDPNAASAEQVMPEYF